MVGRVVSLSKASSYTHTHSTLTLGEALQTARAQTAPHAALAHQYLLLRRGGGGIILLVRSENSKHKPVESGEGGREIRDADLAQRQTPEHNPGNWWASGYRLPSLPHLFLLPTLEMEVKAFFLGTGMGVTPATTGLGGLLSAFFSKANFLVASSHSRP